MWELSPQQGDTHCSYSALTSLFLLVPLYDLGSVASNAAQKTTPSPPSDIMALNLFCSCWPETPTFLLVPEVTSLQPFPSWQPFFPNTLSMGSELFSCCAIGCSESWRRFCSLSYNIQCCADFPSLSALLQQLPSSKKSSSPSPASQRS